VSEQQQTPEEPESEHCPSSWLNHHWKAVGVTALIGAWILFEVCSILKVRSEAQGLLERPLQQIPEFTGNHSKDLRRFRNPFHLRTVARSQVPIITDDSLPGLIATGHLVKVEPNKTLDVREMSCPYLHPAALRELTAISKEFVRREDELGLSSKRLIITSASRSIEFQARLRETNLNAAKQSAHTSGLTFDIHYKRFGSEVLPGSWFLPHHHWLFRKLVQDRAYRDRKGILAQILVRAQEEKRVFVIYERQQPVFHVTVRSLEL